MLYRSAKISKSEIELFALDCRLHIHEAKAASALGRPPAVFADGNEAGF